MILRFGFDAVAHWMPQPTGCGLAMKCGHGLCSFVENSIKQRGW